MKELDPPDDQQGWLRDVDTDGVYGESGLAEDEDEADDGSSD